MYTLDQSIAVKRYFNMINDKLLELYNQSGKENKFHIAIDENEGFDFFLLIMKIKLVLVIEKFLVWIDAILLCFF